MCEVREFWGATLPLALAAAAEPIATSCYMGMLAAAGQEGRKTGHRQKKFSLE